MAVAVVVLGAFGACGGGSDEGSALTTVPHGGTFAGASAPHATPTVPAVPTAAPVAPAASPAASPAAGSVPPAPVASAPTGSVPTGGAWVPPDPESVATIRMPDFAGEHLEDVREALAALGATSTTTVDATGQGRSVWVDSNWKVCASDPKKDKDVKVDKKITLAVVKDGERCP